MGPTTRLITRRELISRGLGATGGAALMAAAQPVRRAEAAPAPRRGGTLVYASSAEVVSLDPPYSGDTASTAITALVFNNLVKYTPDLKILPDLASSWAVQGTQWTFKLRRSVRFHDGTPLDAAGVKAHFDRILGPEKPLRAYQWTPFLESVQVVDDSTVRFVTKFPDPGFLARLANASGAIESPTAFKKYGKDLARHPIGTGPFKFDEWVQDEHITVSRNENYWGDKAYLDQVIVRPVADDSARAIALISGNVQLAIRIPPEQVSRVSSDPRLQVQIREVVGTLFLGMNVLKKPFTDLRVRQALNYAVDKQSIAQNLYQGMAEISNQIVPRGAAGYASAPEFPYNPTKAKRLLAEAGYPNGFTSTMLVTSGAYVKDVELEQAVQQQLAAVGVNVQLQTAEWTRYLQLLRMPPTSSPLEMWLDSWFALDAGQIIQNRFGCQSFRPAGANTAGFCNEDLDGLLTQAQRTLDDTTRNDLLSKAQNIVAQQAPAVWLVQLKEAAGMSKKLHHPLFEATETLTVDEHTWLEA